MRIIFNVIFAVLALFLLLSGNYEMSVLACIMAALVRIEDKLEKKNEA